MGLQWICKAIKTSRKTMKRLLSFLLTPVLLLCPLAVLAQSRCVEHVSDLSPQEKADVRSMALTGTLSTWGNSDFRQLRDLCVRLERLDLSQAEAPVVPDNALHSRHLLRRVWLPLALREIGSQAFFACTRLDSLQLPASVERVGQSAFAGCSSLHTLTIAGTPRLEDFAFARCGALREIRLTSPVPPVAAASAFDGVDVSRCRLVIPPGSKPAYREAEGWQRFFGRQAEPELPDSVNLIPLPLHLQYTGGQPLRWQNVGHIEADCKLDNEVTYLRQVLKAHTTWREGKGKGRITLRTDSTIGDPEAYRMIVTAAGIELTGSTACGVFRGLTTLAQMTVGSGRCSLTSGLPALTIDDEPRTHTRVLMVDPARIFLPMPALKYFVDEMASYKFNTLHLHLVDDQAWRIEIKHYPQLTQQAASRVGMDDMLLPVSGYYTQAEMKELVDYASRRYIEVIPEIEMPGHEVAAIHCFPQLTCGAKQVPLRLTCGVSDDLLCPGEEFVYEFLGNVFRELAEVFPSRYVHLGGDEAGQPPLGCWTYCQKCRALKEKLGIGAGREENWKLQEYLFGRIIDTLRTKHHKTPMFWYETDFHTIPEGCVTYAWRHGLTSAAINAAIRNNARIMLCPGEHCYLDYPMAVGDMPEVNWGMPTTTLEQTYRLDPAWGHGEDFECNHLQGVAGTLWSECITSPERLCYQAFPRALALAEAGWTAQRLRHWTDFCRRLHSIQLDMQRRGVSCSLRW